MPSLDQIRNFLKYRRMKLGDSNNMEGVEEFVEFEKLIRFSIKYFHFLFLRVVKPVYPQ
jgi:hypothetical protein